jgi:uncharacterized membrane protein YoaT (DUF817 family)
MILNYYRLALKLFKFKEIKCCLFPHVLLSP